MLFLTIRFSVVDKFHLFLFFNWFNVSFYDVGYYLLV